MRKVIVAVISKTDAPSVRRLDSPVQRGSRGFTLIELMVAMLVFLIVAGTAFSVFDQHMAMITHQENLSGVNLALRNAAGQLQIDLSGAGENLLGTVPNQNLTFSTGVVIQNNIPPSEGGTAAACTAAGGTYAYPVPSACFDSLTIFGSQSNGCAATTTGQPPVLELETAVDVSSGSTIVGNDPSGTAPATDASCFHAGDELLLIQMPSGLPLSCDAGITLNYCIGAVQIAAAPTPNGSNLDFTYAATGSNGAPTGCPGSSCSDPQGIIYNALSPDGYNFINGLQHSFTGNTYLVDVGGSSSAITYSVVQNPSNSADTQLQRCTSSGCAVLADQIIGFKVGAALWSNEASDQPDIANYFYNSDQYCNAAIPSASTVNCNDVPLQPQDENDPYDFSLVRAVRVSLVARTAPSTDPELAHFTNGFDNGPYLVQQSSVVVDLRNMTIGDFQN